jgi:hypothetical protein
VHASALDRAVDVCRGTALNPTATKPQRMRVPFITHAPIAFSRRIYVVNPVNASA